MSGLVAAALHGVDERRVAGRMPHAAGVERTEKRGMRKFALGLLKSGCQFITEAEKFSNACARPCATRLASRQFSSQILNHMVQCFNSRLDASFAALSDPTRRSILERLGRGEASITDLAEKYHMTLTGMKKHVSILEQAGLVTTKKIGRVRTCRLGIRRLEAEATWIDQYRQLWAQRTDELDKVLGELKLKEEVDERENQ